MIDFFLFDKGSMGFKKSAMLITDLRKQYTWKTSVHWKMIFLRSDSSYKNVVFVTPIRPILRESLFAHFLYFLHVRTYEIRRRTAERGKMLSI
jgi:hypothetical protein